MSKLLVFSLCIFGLMSCGGGGGGSSTPTPDPVTDSDTDTDNDTPPVANTAATITGDNTGSITEGDTSIVSGSLSVSDPDSGEAAFQAQSNVAVEFGTFSISTNGDWTYALDQNDNDLNAITAGNTDTVAITVSSVDDTTETINITVTGIADFSVVAETKVNSDGVGTGSTAYELIEGAFASGSIEAPDFYSNNHHEVEHIIEETDSVVGDHFVFLAHRDLDYDRDKYPGIDDRQRNEIKTYDNSHEDLKSYENETFQYAWKFKVTSDMELSKRFSHFFQIKAKNYSEDNTNGNDSQPMFTLSGAHPTNGEKELQVRHSTGYDTSCDCTETNYLARVDWDLITDEWVEAFVQITYAEAGQFEMTLTRMSDGETIISLEDDNIDTWRGFEAADFVRPKWGIYRSIADDVIDSLRADEERVHFADFTIRKGTLQ